MSRGAVSSLVAVVALSLGACVPHYRYTARVYTLPVSPAPNPVAVSPAATPNAQAELVLHSWVVERAGQAERVSLEQPLHTGDRVALVASASECLYLYVVNLADGKARVIWPHAPTCIGTSPARIPQGNWFELLPPAGHEVVALVATHQQVALDAAGEEYLGSLAQQAADRRDLMRVQGENPPGFIHAHASMGYRAAHLEGEGSALHVPLENDVAVLVVDVDHRPPP